MSNPDHTPLCHCGSCEEAVDAAFKTMEQLLTHQCFHWFIAVTSLQSRVAQSLIDIDPEAAARYERLCDFTAEHSDALTERLDALLDRVNGGGSIN